MTTTLTANDDLLIRTATRRAPEAAGSATLTAPSGEGAPGQARENLPNLPLLELLRQHEQVLCNVNLRRHASGLLQKMQGGGDFHLSPLMCPALRKTLRADIRRRLEGGQTCRVVSAGVMEAGIGVDLPVGYRALSGLDPVNQAAGRVTRNMRCATGKLFVSGRVSEFVTRVPNFVRQGAEVAHGVLRDHRGAPISLPAVQAYCERWYQP